MSQRSSISATFNFFSSISFPLSCLNYLDYCILPISMSTSFLLKMNSLSENQNEPRDPSDLKHTLSRHLSYWKIRYGPLC